MKKRKKKRAPKFYNYTDLAAGYDESDSFIDNSEAVSKKNYTDLFDLWIRTLIITVF